MITCSFLAWKKFVGIRRNKKGLICEHTKNETNTSKTCLRWESNTSTLYRDHMQACEAKPQPHTDLRCTFDFTNTTGVIIHWFYLPDEWLQVKTSSIAHILRTCYSKLQLLINKLVQNLYMFSPQYLGVGCPMLPKTSLRIKIGHRQARALEQRASANYRQSNCTL